MAGVTGLAVIAVTRYIVVFVSQVNRVIMFVAINTTER